MHPPLKQNFLGECTVSNDFLHQDEVDVLFRAIIGDNDDPDSDTPSVNVLDDFLSSKIETVKFMKQIFNIYVLAGFTNAQAFELFKLEIMNDKKYIQKLQEQLKNKSSSWSQSPCPCIKDPILWGLFISFASTPLYLLGSRSRVPSPWCRRF